MGLRRPSERGLRPPPLLHRHAAEPGVLQGVLLVLRLRAGVRRPVAAVVPPGAAPPRPAGLRGAALGPVGGRCTGVETKDSCETSGRDPDAPGVLSGRRARPSSVPRTLNRLDLPAGRSTGPLVHDPLGRDGVEEARERRYASQRAIHCVSVFCLFVYVFSLSRRANRSRMSRGKGRPPSTAATGSHAHRGGGLIAGRKRARSFRATSDPGVV